MTGANLADDRKPAAVGAKAPPGLIGLFAADALADWQRYAVAVAMALVAIGIRFVIAPADDGVAFITIFPTLALSVILCGFGPGLVVLALGGVVGYVYFVPPFGEFGLNLSAITILVTFHLSGLAICLVGKWMHEARAAAHSASVELARSEALYRAIFDQAPTGIVRASSDGHILEANPSLCRLLGYDPAELRGWTLNDLILSPAADDPHGPMNDLRSGLRSSVALEQQSRRKDGTPIWMRLKLSALKAGNVGWYLSTVEDITEQRQTTQKLEAALAGMMLAKEEAEQANRAKSHFLAAASHDLRQPAQALTLLHSLLASRLKDHPAGTLVDAMNAALTAFKMLLEGLLDISRLDAGVVQPEIDVVAVGPVLSRLAEEYAPLCEAKGIALRAVPCAARIRTDPLLLERIARNLLDNAVRYTASGKILIGCRRRSAELRLVVADTGIGIAPNQQDAVFQDFYQVGNPERDRAKGLGLGLSIVKRLADLLGLRVTLRSTLGKGSSFAIDFPLAALPRAVAPPSLPARPVTTAPSATALVIDDEAMVRDSLGLVLSSWGYAVLTAADGEEAIQRLRDGAAHPDIILADYRLRGGKTGINAAAQVRLHCGRPLPTVIVTGDTTPGNAREAESKGFLIAHKPLSAERLREIIDDLTAAPKRDHL